MSGSKYPMMNMSFRMGMIVGLPLGAWIFDKDDWRAVWVMVGVCLIFTIILTIRDIWMADNQGR